ncbi:MAG: alpha-amlyase [Bacteroides sp. SM23_62_1]|nr:MAG: alpha-amlyase [Bacteroides sp. SM23_62_1]
MKTKHILLLLFILPFILSTIHAQIGHVEPPFWWAGMKDTMLQIMVHGKNISDSYPELNYEGVSITSEYVVENPNFLFLNLDLSPDVKPGKFEIHFKQDENIIESVQYELRQRKEGSADREGFNNADVLYLIMPDRFANGDPENDLVEGMKEGYDRIAPYGRHGGDIQGIADHIDYIADMGFTAIWLNPVLENDQPQASYHGYATTDFYKVDSRFGTNEEYRKLGELASEKGIKLIMDMIFNHCGSEHWWMSDMPSADWINLYPDFQITNHRRTVNQDPHASDIDTKMMVEGWFVPTMPDLNLTNPFLAIYMIQNSIWWIEYLGLAGIRMDTYPYPFKYAMSEWSRMVLDEYPCLNIAGEEWTDNPAIVSYWQKGQHNYDGYPGNLPSLMDFPLQSVLARALTEEEGWNSGLQRLYDMLANDFLYPDPYNLVVFADNHDMSRFYMQVGMDAELFKLGIAYILTTRGIPQIFYGTEILMTHTESNEHGYIRKDFPGGWTGDKINGFTGTGLSEKEKEIQNFIKTILKWRKNNTAVHSGKMTHFVPENGIYVYFRHDKDHKVMVILNKNKEDQKLEIHRFNEMLNGITKGRDVITGREYELHDEITVPGMSPLILELK